MWSVSKPDICIWFTRRIVEGCGKVVSFAVTLDIINLFRTVVGIRVDQRDTEDHWVIPMNIFFVTLYWLHLQNNIWIYKHHHQTIHLLKCVLLSSF